MFIKKRGTSYFFLVNKRALDFLPRQCLTKTGRIAFMGFPWCTKTSDAALLTKLYLVTVTTVSLCAQTAISNNKKSNEGRTFICSKLCDFPPRTPSHSIKRNAVDVSWENEPLSNKYSECIRRRWKPAYGIKVSIRKCAHCRHYCRGLRGTCLTRTAHQFTSR